jgi:hypothetical protein
MPPRIMHAEACENRTGRTSSRPEHERANDEPILPMPKNPKLFFYGPLVDLQRFTTRGDSLVLVQAAVLLLLWPILGLPPWNAERSWIDRLGRTVGWGWIIATASVTALGFL